MGVKCVRKYQADDGSLHDTMRDANKHNAAFKVLQSLRTLIVSDGSGPSTLPVHILNNPKYATALRDTLNKSLAYHREYTGKVPKASK